MYNNYILLGVQAVQDSDPCSWENKWAKNYDHSDSLLRGTFWIHSMGGVSSRRWWYFELRRQIQFRGRLRQLEIVGQNTKEEGVCRESLQKSKLPTWVCCWKLNNTCMGCKPVRLGTISCTVLRVLPELADIWVLTGQCGKNDWVL